MGDDLNVRVRNLKMSDYQALVDVMKGAYVGSGLGQG